MSQSKELQEAIHQHYLDHPILPGDRKIINMKESELNQLVTEACLTAILAHEAELKK